MSSQAIFIGTYYFAIERNRAYAGTAGIFTQEPHVRRAILELLEACRERSGWPVKSLGGELERIWDTQESF